MKTTIKLILNMLSMVILMTTLNQQAFAFSEEERLEWSKVGTPTFSAEVEATLPPFTVTLNGVEYDSKNSEYPMLFYKDVTYLPLTYNVMSFMGLKLEEITWSLLDDRARTKFALLIDKNEINSDILAPYEKADDGKTEFTALVYDAGVAVQWYQLTLDEEYPILYMNDIYYLPLTYEYVYKLLGWEYSFSSESGVSVDTTKAVRPIIGKARAKSMIYGGLGIELGAFYIYGHDCYISYYRHRDNIVAVGRDGESSVINPEEIEALKNIRISSMMESLDEHFEEPTYRDGILSFSAYCYGEAARISFDTESFEVVGYYEYQK